MGKRGLRCGRNLCGPRTGCGINGVGCSLYLLAGMGNGGSAVDGRDGGSGGNGWDGLCKKAGGLP